MRDSALSRSLANSCHWNGGVGTYSLSQNEGPRAGRLGLNVP